MVDQIGDAVSQDKLGYLERCLRLWGAWEKGYRFGPQPVRVAIWAHQRGVSARADASAIAHLSTSDRWVAQHVSKGVEALPRRDWQIVLEVEYVWNGACHHVFRSNRLPNDALVLAELLNGAKVALVPILRGRGLPL